MQLNLRREMRLRTSLIYAASALLLPAVGTVVLTTRSAFAIPRQATDNTTYTLQRTFKAGDISRYKLVMHITVTPSQATGNDIEAAFTLRYKETVKQIKPDSSVVVQDEFEKASLTANQQDIDLTSSMPKVTQTFSPKGQLTAVTADGGSAQFNGMVTQIYQGLGRTQAYFPPKPVKVGDTWMIDFTDPNSPDNKTTGTATLVGTETAAGMQTLKIKVNTDAKLKVPSDPTDPSSAKVDATAHFEGTVNADPKNGGIVRLAGKMNSEAPGVGKNKADLDLSLLTGNETGDAKNSGQ